MMQKIVDELQKYEKSIYVDCVPFYLLTKPCNASAV